MSFFIPLNVYEEDVIQDAEQHTRELQIEEALKLYQTALEHQRAKQQNEAHKAYKSLFNIEVLKLTQETGLPPAAEKLKYLASKNYALLLLYELEKDIDEISKQELTDRTGTILDWISDALMYNTEDASFLHVIRAISIPLGYPRIARLALECILYSSSRIVPLDEEYISNNGNVGPDDSKALIRFRDLLRDMGDSITLKEHRIFKVLNNARLPTWIDNSDHSYSWLVDRHDIGDSMSRMIHTEQEDRGLDITLTSVDWVSISIVLHDAVLATIKGRKKFPHEDPYAYSTEPVNSVRFVLPHGETIQIQNKNDVLPDNPAELEVEMDQDTISTPVGTPDINLKKKKRRSDFIDPPSRSSKRVKARSDEPKIDNIDLSGDEAFFDQLNGFISKAGAKFESVIPIFLDEDYSEHEQYIQDFKCLLQGWDDEQAELFFRNDDNSSVLCKARRDGDDSSSLMQILDFAALGNGEQSRLPYIANSELASQFIYMINSGTYPIQEVRLIFVVTMLRCHRQNSREFNTKRSLKILDTDAFATSEKISLLFDHWPQPLVQNLKRSICQLEQLLYKTAKEALLSGDAKAVLVQLQVCQGIFELVVDKFLELSKSASSWEKNKDKEEACQREVYINRVRMWHLIVCDLLSVYQGEEEREASIVSLRHDWTNIYFRQAIGSTASDSRDMYENIRKTLSSIDEKTEILFSNYSHIPRLSLESISTQISKVEATAIFSQVFSNSDEINQEYRARTLEAILMPEEQPSLLSEHESISQFLSSASSEFKLQLWYRLLEVYNNMGETSKSFDGFLRIFVSTVGELTSEEYESKNEHERQVLIIKTLHVCSDVGSNLLRIIDEYEGDLFSTLAESRLRESLNSITSLLRMLYLCIFLTDAITNNIIQAPSHLSWEKVVGQVQELTIKYWCLFYYIFRALLPESNAHPDILNDVLSIVHEVVGNRGFCGAADAALLKLSLKEFVRMDWEESEADLLQCLHCRYGLGLGNEHFVPTDHHCTPAELDKSVPINTSKFIIRSAVRRKNLTQSLLRTEFKNVLDQYYEVLGQPDKDEYPFSQNSGVLEEYLSLPITFLTMTDALKGRIYLSLTDSNADYVRVGKAGFYYAYGQVQYSLFKIRKKTSSALTDDLDECIQLFLCDLMCNTNRFESWYMVAQAYDALASDAMTWSADKLNNSEQKKVIASHQRRSILACAMAINIHLQNIQSKNEVQTSNIHYQHYSSGLWGTYAKLLYNASRSPMNMGAFEDIPSRVFCGPNGVYTKSAATPISSDTVTKVVKKLLTRAISSTPSEWYNYYILSKVLRALDAPAAVVIQCLLDGLNHTPDKHTSHSEIFIEPHYKLITFAFKYVRSGDITSEQAMEYIQKSLFFEPGNKLPETDDDEATKKFYASCLNTLQKIRNGDKKRWHHRPTYRMAKILDDIYNSKEQAMEEMSGIFTLKTSQKNAIMIWKPDLERPGEHYKFVFQYVMYFVELLRDTEDSDSLMVLARKLRKFQYGIINHHQAWEHLCTSAGICIKQILGIDPKYTDIIPTLVFDEFYNMANKLTAAVETRKLAPKWLGWLNYSQEFRKLNNSLGSTAALDDLFVAIYLNIYYSSLALLENLSDAHTPAVSTTIPSAPSTPRNVMSVANLVAPPITPVAQTPEAELVKVSPNTAVNSRVRVTRRDIITRAVALIRSIPDDVRDNLEPKIVEIKGSSSKPTSNGKASHVLSDTPSPSAPSTPKGEVIDSREVSVPFSQQTAELSGDSETETDTEMTSVQAIMT